MKRLMVVVLVIVLAGCGTTKILYREMPKDTSESAIILRGRLLKKEPIVGKGWEAEVKGQIEAKVTNKDGTVVEIKTMKPSFFEKFMSFFMVAKPNSVGIGK